MKKKNKARSIKFSIILSFILVISVGYAALSAIFGINGKMAFYKNFDVYLDNINVQEGSASASTPATITDKTSLDFSADFYSVTDYYQFSFDIVNDSKVKAMISNINKPVFTADQEGCLNFTLTYLDGTDLKVYDTIMPGTYVRVTAQLKCSEGFTEEDFKNTTLKGLGFSTSFDFVPADENANVITPHREKLVMLNFQGPNSSGEARDFGREFNNATTVVINDRITNHPNATKIYDLSAAGDGTIIGCVEDNIAFIEGNGEIYAPADSVGLLVAGKATEINGLNLLNTSEVTDFGCMFAWSQNLTSLDLSSFDFSSKQANTYGPMFQDCSNLTEIIVSTQKAYDVVTEELASSNLTGVNVVIR